MILLTGCVIAFIIFILMFMSIIEGAIRDKRNEKIIWKMENMNKRDRVVTRTGGLENDRLNERQ